MNEHNVRRGWIIGGSVVAVVMLGFGGIQAIGLVARQDRTVRDRFDASGLSVVDVTSDDGDVVVIGDEETAVRVVIRLSEGWRKVERTARIDGDRLVLASSCPWFGGPFCDADYEVHVPPGMRVVARSDNGDATVRDVDGGAELVSSNGNVVGRHLAGKVTLRTDNGDATATGLAGATVSGTSNNGDVSLSFATSPQSATAISNNGDVDVLVPRGPQLYAVDATTDNGDVRTPIRTDPTSSRRLIARSDNGDVVVRYS